MTLDKAITDLETEYKSDFNLQLAAWLKDYKRLLESCEYAVSREDVIKTIQRHSKRYSLAKESEYMGVVEWSDHLISEFDITKTIEALPSVQPKQVECEDAISRAEALKAINKMDIPEDMSVFEIKSHIGVEIGTLPPVQPKILACGEGELDVPDTNVGETISRADVEQTVEDNILCYTHSDRPIDQDPDTECHMAIRMALRMLRKDLRKLPPVTPRSLNPEADREESKAYCAECDHIEMCSWYPHDGCEWLKTDRYNAGYNAAKREIALSGEYERAYERGKADAHPDINDGKLSEIPTGSESEDKE